MGAGKTSIGRQVAQLVGFEFLDSDAEIEHRTGANIPWIFDVEGEQGFRDREQSMIDELSLRSGIVLATGGGSVMRDINRQHLSSRGVVVYLKTSVEEQIARTSRDRNRPLLQTDDPDQVLRDLMEKRGPLYLEVADVIVETDNRNVKEVAKEIVDQVKSHSK